MKLIKIAITPEELALLVSLASDQLFRREFIDPKMPGQKADPAAVRMGKALIGRLQEIAKGAQSGGASVNTVTERVSGDTPKRANGAESAI